MKTYRVIWEIDIDAKTHKEAAEKALEIQRDVDSLATFFKVIGPPSQHSTNIRYVNLITYKEVKQ